MGRALRVAVVLSVVVLSLAIGAARSDFLLYGEPVDGDPSGFWNTAYLAAIFAAWPLAVIWLGVLVVFLVRRAVKLPDES